MTDDMMTIREMRDRFGVTARALRFYEARGLLAPVRKGQKRLFTRDDRDRLKLIQRGKRIGFSLEEIRDLLDHYETSGTKLARLHHTYGVAEQRLEKLKEERESLTAAIRVLTAQLRWARGMIARLQGQTRQGQTTTPEPVAAPET